MFRFEHPDYLYALVLLPMLAALFIVFWRWRRKALKKLAHSSLLPQLIPGTSKYKHPVKFLLLMLGLAFLIIGAANPQWGNKREKVKRKSIDVLIALDISTSMYAEDIAPNRLERAKKFAENLVEKLKGEQIGLILFAGSAYLQMPVTTDYATAELFIRSASPNLAGTQGTAIAEAIDLARRSFSENNQSHKALIIITDGEDHDGEALEAAQKAREEGVIQFTVGVGTEEGGFIPVFINGREDYKRDESGQPVRSKLNNAILEELARKGDGAYFQIESSDEVAEALQQRIDQVEKRELEVRAFTSFNSFFQYFLAAGLLLMVFEFVISYRKARWMEGRDFFK
jgi:Ca-activated chloride channel family protein